MRDLKNHKGAGDGCQRHTDEQPVYRSNAFLICKMLCGLKAVHPGASSNHRPGDLQ